VTLALQQLLLSSKWLQQQQQPTVTRGNQKYLKSNNKLAATAAAQAQAQQFCLTFINIAVVVMSATAMVIVNWQVGRLCTRYRHHWLHPMPYPWHMPKWQVSVLISYTSGLWMQLNQAMQ